MDDIKNNQENSSQGLELKKYFFKAVSYWYLFVISIAVSIFIAKWINKHAIPTFGLHATVMLMNESNEDEVAGGLTLFSKRKNLNTQMGILNSYSLTEETVKELEFEISYFRDERFRKNYEVYKKSPFVVNFDTTYVQYIGLPVYVVFKSENEIQISIEKFEIEKTLKLGEQFVYNKFSFNITKRDSLPFNNNITGDKYFFRKNNINSIVQRYLSRIEIEVSPEKSSILWLWLIGTVPQKDADYLNKLIEIYIRNGLQEKNRKAASIIEFIDEQLEGVSDSLRKTETNLQLFKQQNRTLDISSEGMLLLTKLTEFRKDLVVQKRKISYYQYLHDQLISDNTMESLTAPTVMGIIDPVLLGYLAKLSEYLLERDILDFSVRSDIPISEKLDMQIQKILDQI